MVRNVFIKPGYNYAVYNDILYTEKNEAIPKSKFGSLQIAYFPSFISCLFFGHLLQKLCETRRILLDLHFSFFTTVTQTNAVSSNTGVSGYPQLVRWLFRSQSIYCALRYKTRISHTCLRTHSKIMAHFQKNIKSQKMLSKCLVSLVNTQYEWGKKWEANQPSFFYISLMIEMKKKNTKKKKKPVTRLFSKAPCTTALISVCMLGN